MGTKLTITFLSILLCFSMLSCMHEKRIQKSDYYVPEKDYFDSYRTAVICGCINSLTNDSLNVFMTQLNDIGLFSDIDLISLATAKEADSLGRKLSRSITPVEYVDAGYKKAIFSGCIKTGLSKTVDSIISLKYKQLIRSLKKGDQLTLLND